MFGTPTSSASRNSVVEEIWQAEKFRQWRKLILIPSESICHPEVAKLLASEFTNLYAEGRPDPILCPDPRHSALDARRFQSWQTRLADHRFYRGCVNANRVELLAQRYIAQVFAQLEGSPSAEDIYVNVQALSGAPANLAVYQALLHHGDTILGLDLRQGGHLTHGSEFNFSGKTYRAYHYGIDPRTRKLDYDQIARRAAEVKPRMMIAGASAYPWDFDWARLDQIARDVGALLLADIAHLAGMVAAGELHNPLPYCDVVTFTTHKTLCGPRGAVILSSNPEIAAKLDTAVFPGLQGGPHVNNMAAIARLFELILEDRESFKSFQRAILDNTNFFAQCLEKEELPLEYDGTNTHLLLVDLKRFPVKGEVALDGEIASRLLEIAGIVCNKNALPGDLDGAHATGIRLGMPWLTQRGITRDQIKELAAIIRLVLSEARTTQVWVSDGERCRARVPSEVFAEASSRTLAIAQALPIPTPPPTPAPPQQATTINGHRILRVRGDKTRFALEQLLTCNIARLSVGDVATGLLLRQDGSIIDRAIVSYGGRTGREECYLLAVSDVRGDEVKRWLAELSDGYVLFDEEDLQAKIDGPSVVEEVNSDEVAAELKKALAQSEAVPFCTDQKAADIWKSTPALFDLAKPYFVGQESIYPASGITPKETYTYESEQMPLRQTVLNQRHKELGANMVEFNGWEMPLHYPTGIFAEHRAVRTAAGLFDISHMNIVEVGGTGALGFLDIVMSNCVSRLEPGHAQYTSLLQPDGKTIDDVFLYRLTPERFLLVLNAANVEEDIAWLLAANSRRFLIDPDMPGKEVGEPVTIRPMRDADGEALIGLALQGPISRQILEELADGTPHRAALRRLLQNQITSMSMAGISLLVSRTGYTGELIGYELLVHPQRAEELWRRLLEVGKPMGVLPAGLGARDSTRLEAGLPLFGYELEGEAGLTPTDIDYGFIVRFHRPFFIGRNAYMARANRPRKRLLRLRGKGGKTVRTGHTLIDDSGAAVGRVTSFAYVDARLNFYVLAAVDADFAPAPGSKVRGVRLPLQRYYPPPNPRSVVELTVMPRFPDDEERRSWRRQYGAIRVYAELPRQAFLPFAGL